jgi:hypothetical protein
MDLAKIINLYRGPSIAATYQVSVHLTKRFQRRRFFMNRPISNPVENDILNAEKTVNKEKMASYAEILKDDGKENENTNTNINTKSNSFLKDEDVFGSSMKPARSKIVL